MLRFNLVLVSLLIYSQSTFATSKIDSLIERGDYGAAVQLSIKNNKHYLAELIKETRSLKLAKNSVWLALGHYKKNVFSGYTSQVDGNDYFLATNGKYDPQDELEATIAAFFSDRKMKPNNFSIQCRFVARYYWLNKKLKFNSGLLKEEACKNYQTYLDILAPDKLTVVFPTTHPNSPSSMFGHTLLRIDKKERTAETAMLNYSINYAAFIAPGTNSFSYSILGLSGGFPGKFSIVPYYQKLREYVQMENRDIWEYTLNISPEKINFILMHTYELSPSYFDYYFFTENCSYHLLSLLDVSFADDPFTDNFKGWTIPIDTLRILRERNLVSSVSFKPSHAGLIRLKQEMMGSEDLALTNKAYYEGLENSTELIKMLNEDRQIQILDLLNDYYRFKKLKESKHSATKLNKQERKILLMRSKIKKPSQLVQVTTPPVHPDLGHGSSKVGIGYTQVAAENNLLLRWRAAYHDLLDPSAGFGTNSSLEFMNIGLSYSESREKLSVGEVTILNIMSLEARDKFFSNISWQLSTGWKKRAEVKLNNLSYAELDGGYAYTLDNKARSMGYALFGGAFMYSDDLEKNARIAPEIKLGIVAEIIPRWRAHIQLKTLKGVIGDSNLVSTFSLQQSVAISRELSIRANYLHGLTANASWDEIGLEIHYSY